MPKFSHIEWNEFRSSFGEQWQRLVSASAANPSNHLEWQQTVIDTQGLEDVHVFTQQEGGRLIGGIPYFRQHATMLGIPVRRIETVGNVISYHQTLLCEGNRVALLQGFIESLDNWDVLRITNLIRGGSSDQAVREVPGLSRLLASDGQTSPYLPIEGDFDRFLATKPKKFRYKFRRRPKDMDDAGRWEMRWFEGREVDLDALMADVLTIEAASWKVKVNRSIHQRPDEAAYTRAILRVLIDRNALVANVLYLEDKPIAYSLSYHWGGLMGQMKTSYDEAYTPLSAGSLVIDASVQRAFELRAREFDFLGDSQPHKRAWSREEREHVRYSLFNRHLKGRLLGHIAAIRQQHEQSRQAPAAETAADHASGIRS